MMQTNGSSRRRIGAPVRNFGTQMAALAGGNRGASMIEFALVAPFLIMLVLGIGDLSRGFSELFALQQAVNRTIEMAHLGTGASDFSYLIPEAAAAAKVPVENVTLEKWLECDGRRVDYAGTCAAGEQSARYLRLQINSSFTPSFGSSAYPNAQPDGTVPISAHTALRIQ